jgi:predicted anti-sigma-YlaC factor YlaD
MHGDLDSDRHGAMRRMIDRSLAGEATAEEQQSLREHLRECGACQQYADAGRRAVAGLGGFSFAAGPGLERKVMAALAVRARQLESTELSRRRIVRSCVGALVLTVLGSIGGWMAGDLLVGLLHLARGQTQAGVLALWVLPSWGFTLVLPLVLLLSARSARQKGRVL